MSSYMAVNYPDNDSSYIKNFGIEDNPSLAHWGPGKRDYCIIHYVIKGSGYFNGRKVEANQGFIIYENEMHEYHSSINNPWNYFWVILSCDLVKKYFISVVDIDEYGFFSFDYKERILKLAGYIFSGSQSISHYEALGYFFFLTSFNLKNNKTEKNIPLRHIRNAKTFIESNCSKKIKVGDVAKAVHINERYMYNIFVKFEGITPKEYIDMQKINYVSSLLADTDMTVSEIAFSAGFSDVCTFSKFFNIKMGMSPTEYRSQKDL